MRAFGRASLYALVMAAVPADAAFPQGAPSAYRCARIGSEAARPEAAGPTSAFVTTRDGVRLFVTEAGPRDAPAVLLLHGYPDSGQSFDLVLPLLAREYRVVVPDQRGLGCSDRPSGPYGMADLAEDAVTLLDALGIERAAVVGHSMGSLVAQQMAARHPGRIDRLVLIGAGSEPAAVPGIVELSAEVQRLADPVPEPFIRAFQESTFRREVPASFVEAVIAESSRPPARVWRALMDGMMATRPVASAIPAEVPVLLVWGDFDEVLGGRPVQDALLATIPDATLLCYAGTGHAPHWEEPGRFAEDVRRFLSGRPPLTARSPGL